MSSRTNNHLIRIVLFTIVGSLLAIPVALMLNSPTPAPTPTPTAVPTLNAPQTYRQSVLSFIESIDKTFQTMQTQVLAGNLEDARANARNLHKLADSLARLDGLGDYERFQFGLSGSATDFATTMRQFESVTGQDAANNIISDAKDSFSPLLDARLELQTVPTNTPVPATSTTTLLDYYNELELRMSSIRGVMPALKADADTHQVENARQTAGMLKAVTASFAFIEMMPPPRGYEAFHEKLKGVMTDYDTALGQIFDIDPASPTAKDDLDATFKEADKQYKRLMGARDTLLILLSSPPPDGPST